MKKMMLLLVAAILIGTLPVNEWEKLDRFKQRAIISFIGGEVCRNMNRDEAIIEIIHTDGFILFFWEPTKGKTDI
ncbi:MAG: hypothetical protein WC461_00695 [Candidatus Paceibacterota bacterium]